MTLFVKMDQLNLYKDVGIYGPDCSRTWELSYVYTIMNTREKILKTLKKKLVFSAWVRVNSLWPI
jgi:hypothetical protein